MAMEPIDYVDLARSRSRDEFVSACPFPFLSSADALARPQGPQPTLCGAEFPDLQRFLAGGPPPSLERERALVFAVRKITKAFPSMITIGRTSNHDIVISDVLVSKFHAFIRVVDGRFELLDAGSSNGTWLGEQRLRKRDPQALAFGDTVRFGRLKFHFLDAGGCWDKLRQRDGG